LIPWPQSAITPATRIAKYASEETMRLTLLAAVAAIALAACNNETETPADVAEAPAEPVVEAPVADAHAGHGPMDTDMASADAADDANTAETPDQHMFHTYPAKTEMVHLPSAGAGSWTATASDAALVAVNAAADETMPDGTVHHVVKVDTLASGNAEVKFERRESADPAAAVVETRTVFFMIH
jgi:hypothetical protein